MFTRAGFEPGLPEKNYGLKPYDHPDSLICKLCLSRLHKKHKNRKFLSFWRNLPPKIRCQSCFNFSKLTFFLKFITLLVVESNDNCLDI